MDESRLRTLLGTDLAEASHLDLRGTLGREGEGTTGDLAASDAPTLVFDTEGGGDGAGERLVETGYELEEEVGRGGMNVVFRARQAGLERDVAVKRLLAKRRSSRGARWAFLSEASVTAQLEHPNVIPVYGLSVDAAGDAALAMKLMRGKSWEHHLREEFADDDPSGVPRGLEANLRVLTGVANAVAFAHSRGVLHRDLKPENVMIGDFGEVLVVDWGLAVRFTDVAQGVRAPHRSAVKRMAGTPVYMAPEMVEANGDALGPTTDVYLLGGLLHEILTGRPPHAGKKLVDVLLSAFDSAPPIFSSAVPVELQDLCRCALARDPADRPGSALEFRNAIEDYLAHSESLQICQRSAERLEQCQRRVEEGIRVETRAELYSDLRDVIAGFAAARGVWEENDVAADGETTARLLLARSALAMGELGTAESALRGQDGEEVGALSAEIAEAVKTREGTLRTTRRVSVSLLLLQLLVAVALGVWGFFELRAYHLEIEVAELERLTPLVALAIKESKVSTPTDLEPLVDRIARDLASQGPLRVTVADRAGRVLADSEAEADGLPSHADRPEFVAAARLGQGTATRWSETLEQELVYFAIPIRDAKGEPTLLVRLAIPVEFITVQLRALVGAVALAFVVSVLSTSLVTMFLTRHLTRAIERIR